MVSGLAAALSSLSLVNPGFVTLCSSHPFPAAFPPLSLFTPFRAAAVSDDQLENCTFVLTEQPYVALSVGGASCHRST